MEPPTEFPELLSHIWLAFICLNGTRPYTEFGPGPITYEEIKSWKELTDTPLLAWEIEAIKRLDVVYLGTVNG